MGRLPTRGGEGLYPTAASCMEPFSPPLCRPLSRTMSGPNDDDTNEPAEAVRPELAELRARMAATTDEGRPEAVAKRRKTGQRTARENIAALVDEGSFVEYGA